ncbi:hypothetical protein [Sorangium sp. So ce388]|uniref:hypothetical protein n=1 Tax=Sorangium sp. So ce388 TaxID=3133309 RepID=UPI003F5B20B9
MAKRKKTTTGEDAAPQQGRLVLDESVLDMVTDLLMDIALEDRDAAADQLDEERPAA